MTVEFEKTGRRQDIKRLVATETIVKKTGLESQEGSVGFKHERLIMSDSHFECHGIWRANVFFYLNPSAAPVSTVPRKPAWAMAWEGEGLIIDGMTINRLEATTILHKSRPVPLLDHLRGDYPSLASGKTQKRETVL